MAKGIPSADEVRETLAALSYTQVGELSRLSGVPINTLWNVRGGKTENPGIETVRKFMPHVKDVLKAAA